MNNAVPICIEWVGEMVLARAEEVRDQLLTALTEGQPVQLDCSKITEADISFIQLLLAARSSAIRRSVPFSLKLPLSHPLQVALRRGGFLSAQPLPSDDLWTFGD